MGEQQPYQPQIYEESVISQTPQAQVATFDSAFIEKIDPSKVISIIEHSWRAEFYNEDLKKWEKVGGAPIMNNIGTSEMKAEMQSIIGQHGCMSNLSKELVSKITIETGYRIQDKLLQNYERYELDISNFDTIIDNICDMDFLVLRRSMDDKERAFMRTSIKSQEQILVRPPEKKPWHNPF